MVKTVSFKLKPSRYRKIFLLGSYATAVVLVLSLSSFLPLSLLLVGVLLACGCYFWYRVFSFQGKATPRFSLEFDGEAWRLGLERYGPMRLESYYLLPFLARLLFVDADRNRSGLLLFCDEFSAPDWRNLRRICKGL